jgi:S-formylglutathione hydrolase FrmB
MMFSTWDWHVKNFETSDAFDRVMAWLHAWRMPLLFFISGSAVWFAMDRYTTWRFFLERQRRLLLPLGFGMLVIIPPQVYIERLYHHENYSSFWDFYPTVFTSGPYPQGNLSWHHLWYIPYIWAFSMIMLPVFVGLRSRSGRVLLEKALAWVQRPWALFLLFIPSALAEVALRPSRPWDANNLFSDWANFTHKLTFFFIGFALASNTEVSDSIATHRRKFLIAGIIASALMIPVGNHTWHIGNAGYRVLSNFHVWAWLLVMLGYGRTYLSFNHKFLRYSNEAVYPFYIVHQTVIIFLAYQLAYVNCGIPLKFLVVASGTFLICWVLYAFAIKPWNVLRVVFGMKAIRARTDEGQGPKRPIVPVVSKLVLPLALILSITSCSRDEDRLVCRKMHAPSLSHNSMGIADDQEVVVYLPPSYGQTNRRFPVLYFLPNFRCQLWRYTGGTFQGFRFEQAMARQLQAGTVKEMIIVVPNATHFLGSSWYRNSPLTGNWEDFISHDLVSYVDAQFRTISTSEGRALAGHGLGGLGALELTLKHPDVFGSVYAMSPAVLDEKGLANFGSLPGQTARVWSGNLKEWKDLDDASRRKRFRDFIQASLNSPSSSTSGQGWLISCAAAVCPDPRLPFPHIAFPLATDSAADINLMTQLESGMGGWKQKLQEYAASGHRLRSITIEYGASDQYDFVRHGSDYVSGLMRSMGIKNELAIHEGGHESTLGKRLERDMLPSISNSLRYD